MLRKLPHLVRKIKKQTVAVMKHWVQKYSRYEQKKHKIDGWQNYLTCRTDNFKMAQRVRRTPPRVCVCVRACVRACVCLKVFSRCWLASNVPAADCRYQSVPVECPPWH